MGPLERQAVPSGPGVALVQVPVRPRDDQRADLFLRGFGRLGVQLKAPAHRQLCTDCARRGARRSVRADSVFSWCWASGCHGVLLSGFARFMTILGTHQTGLFQIGLRFSDVARQPQPRVEFGCPGALALSFRVCLCSRTCAEKLRSQRPCFVP